MAAVFLTGMSGAGKSATLLELARRGIRVVDTDADEWNEWVQAPDGPDWVWRLDRLHALLDEVGPEPLVLAGCRSNQGALYPCLRAAVLLTAPLLRRSATLVLDTAQLSVAQVADQVEALLNGAGAGAPLG